ncbi:structural maintenance of chromosomes protein 6 [Copidosoma floridanum]|uniref:structural maintenance of chromosomes protein 6 n=1 Tax=Copidosoma floridanum TaxID=29053 RepID=UPI0006C93CA6|nr:structural maintenance of chromosomes protein 6 [Copidosoma floridanum]
MAAEKLSQGIKRKTTNEDESPTQKRLRKTVNDSFEELEDGALVAGKITRVFMKNFMCHDAMEVNFNQRVNFIVGANGSGKSAILTALTVGLGARAKITNRGPSIKEFIKKGKSSCLIEISVTNDGPLPYKYENYGNIITIVRTISQSASGYKIKNWKGDTISTKREELDSIIQQLNIQVDNPISVLNQDVSRTFLVSANSSDKYKLFMKATRLDVIGENYRKAAESSEVTKQSLQEARKHLSENENDIARIKKKLKALDSLVETREEYNSVNNEIMWATAIQEEKKLLDIDAKIESQQANVEKLKNLESSKATKEQKINEKIEVLKQEIAQHEAEASGSEAKLNEVKQSLKEASKLHDQKKEKWRAIHQSIKRKENEISDVSNEIKKLEKARGGAEKQELTEELKKCEEELETVVATLQTKQTELMHFEENKRLLDQQYHNASMDVEQKKINLTKLRQKLTAFKRQSSDVLTVYGQNMPRLLKRIEEEHQKGRFKHKPVGPLGHFIKVKDPRWIPAVENHLGFGTLTLFCVDNIQDNRVLTVIMNEVFRGDRLPQVVISRFFDRVHNVSEGCTHSPRYMNLLDAMEISHPVIANSLIDQREVECILLIPTSDEACEVMSDARKVPQNTRRAITMNADLFFPDPQYRTYGGSVTKPRYLQVSTSDAIQSLQEEIGVAEDELRLAESQCLSIREKKLCIAQELNQVLAHVKNLKQNQQNLSNKIDKLKDQLDTYNDESINAFKTELEICHKWLAEKKEEESRMAVEFNESKKHVNTLNDECKVQRDLRLNLDAKLQPIKDHIKELKDEKNRLNVSNKGAARRMEEAKQILQKLAGEHEQQQRVVNSKVESAENTCPRMESTRSIGDLNNRSKELKVMIETMEREHGSKDDLLKELEEKQKMFYGVREFAVELQRSNDKHMDRLRKRKVFYNEMKKKISERVQKSFSNILSLRNYKGKITIDHHKKELSLEVTPKNDAKRTTHDAKALSGGERSYSTVAFILALWDSTRLPFYFLDEFDVFMDKINRRVILDILLQHAQNHPHSQFAFLTPLDTSHIIADNSITIHRLAPPERSS